MRLASLSRLLIASCAVVMLGACDENSSTPGGGDGTPNPNTPNTPKTPPPQSLQGEWQYGALSLLDFWDDDSQMVKSGGGAAVYFDFKADGSYRQYIYVSITNYNCRSMSWSSTEGTATFEEGTFHLYPSKGRSKFSSCTHSNDIDAALTADEIEGPGRGLLLEVRAAVGRHHAADDRHPSGSRGRLPPPVGAAGPKTEPAATRGVREAAGPW